MAERIPASELANIGAQVVRDAHLTYRTKFTQLTKRAERRFAGRMWRELHDDANQRIDLYSAEVGRTVARLRSVLHPRSDERIVWAALKAVYSGLHTGQGDRDVAETFFNSVTRRIFDNVGVDPDIEFVHPDTDTPLPPDRAIAAAFAGDARTQVQRVLAATPLGDLLVDPAGDATRAAQRLVEALGSTEVTLEMIRQPLYREQGAYLVGRATADGQSLPFVICLRHPPEGVRVDAVLTEMRAVSILFSFTRSHFLVDATPPAQIVRFLRGVLPNKSAAELYVSIGEFKHGKTEIFRDLLDHLETSTGRFVPAPGIPGLVMEVFGLPQHRMVIKVIRDRFAPPKQTTRREVMDRYRFVFRNDRAGRLVEAHEFEHLAVPIDRFEPPLLESLLAEAGNTVAVNGDQVIIDHAYLERRVQPLDLYLRQHPGELGAAAVRDYGQAIEELAHTDIFCGDILPKNFGLTPTGRVVFYDYDELDLVSRQRFLPIPPLRDIDDIMAAEPSYGVGRHDVFPAEWPAFLGLSSQHRHELEDGHGHIFDHDFWRAVQDRVAEGEPHEVLPYSAAARL